MSFKTLIFDKVKALPRKSQIAFGLACAHRLRNSITIAPATFTVLEGAASAEAFVTIGAYLSQVEPPITNDWSRLRRQLEAGLPECPDPLLLLHAYSEDAYTALLYTVMAVEGIEEATDCCFWAASRCYDAVDQAALILLRKALRREPSEEEIWNCEQVAREIDRQVRDLEVLALEAAPFAIREVLKRCSIERTLNSDEILERPSYS